jgi:hypothetical protein
MVYNLNNTYERRVDRAMPAIDGTVNQYRDYFVQNRELFDHFEFIVEKEYVDFIYIRRNHWGGVFRIEYSNEKIIEEPHGRVKTISAEEFRMYSIEIYEFSRRLLEPSSFPFVSILKDGTYLSLACEDILQINNLTVSFALAKNGDCSDYTHFEELDGGWHINWLIRELT